MPTNACWPDTWTRRLGVSGARSQYKQTFPFHLIQVTTPLADGVSIAINNQHGGTAGKPPEAFRRSNMARHIWLFLWPLAVNPSSDAPSAGTLSDSSSDSPPAGSTHPWPCCCIPSCTDSASASCSEALVLATRVPRLRSQYFLLTTTNNYIVSSFAEVTSWIIPSVHLLLSFLGLLCHFSPASPYLLCIPTDLFMKDI